MSFIVHSSKDHGMAMCKPSTQWKHQHTSWQPCCSSSSSRCHPERRKRGQHNRRLGRSAHNSHYRRSLASAPAPHSHWFRHSRSQVFGSTIRPPWLPLRPVAAHNPRSLQRELQSRRPSDCCCSSGETSCQPHSELLSSKLQFLHFRSSHPIQHWALPIVLVLSSQSLIWQVHYDLWGVRLFYMNEDRWRPSAVSRGLSSIGKLLTILEVQSMVARQVAGLRDTWSCHVDWEGSGKEGSDWCHRLQWTVAYVCGSSSPGGGRKFFQTVKGPTKDT